MIDTIHAVQTPEGVELSLRVAGPVARGLAWVVDALLRLLLMLGVGIASGVAGNVGTGISMIGMFAIWWFFPVGFEMYRDGQTPGKAILGLRVVQENGTPVTWSASILRNFLRVVDFLPMLYGIGLCTMLIDRSFRRLGDLAAGTLVVYVAGPGGTPLALPDAVPLAPPVPLALAEQRAVIAFVERAPFLTPERAAELAAIPTPLLGGAGPGEARERLERIAAWLVGGGGRA